MEDELLKDTTGIDKHVAFVHELNSISIGHLELPFARVLLPLSRSNRVTQFDVLGAVVFLFYILHVCKNLFCCCIISWPIWVRTKAIAVIVTIADKYTA
jgi:hypothetical protein